MTPPRPEGRGLQVLAYPGHVLSARGTDFRPKVRLNAVTHLKVSLLEEIREKAKSHPHLRASRLPLGVIKLPRQRAEVAKMLERTHDGRHKKRNRRDRQ